MTEDNNTQHIAAIVEAFGRGDISYILDQLTDDVRWVAHLDPIVPWAGDYSGKEEVPPYFQALVSSVEVTAAATEMPLCAWDDLIIRRDIGRR